MDNKTKVQATITKKNSVLIYQSIKQGLKAKALEHALLLLAKEQNIRSIFFNEDELKKIDIALSRDKIDLEDDTTTAKTVLSKPLKDFEEKW